MTTCLRGSSRRLGCDLGALTTGIDPIRFQFDTSVTFAWSRIESPSR